MKKSLRVLGIIPARGGSKRVPRKNVAKVGGLPLIAHAIRAANASKLLDACVVSTDDAAIAAIAKKYGADVPFLRPKQFATDGSPDIEYARHAVEWWDAHRDWKPDIIVLLPPDVPLRTGKDIDAVIRHLMENELDSVRTIAGPIRHPLIKAMWIRGTGALIDPLHPEFVGKPSQQVPDYYVSVGIAYATRASFVRKGKLWGPRVGGFVVNPERALEIDENDHLLQAQRLFRKPKR